MAPSEVYDYRAGSMAYVDGKPVKVVSSHADYVIVEDEKGNKSSVKKEFLMKTPLFNFQNPDFIKERKDKIAYYQNLAEEAGKEKKDFLAQVFDLFKKMGMYNKNDKEYKIIKDEYWTARMNKTAAGNREYSYYLDAFMVASDTSNWC